MALSVSVTGVDKVLAKLEEIGRDAPRELAKALYQDANELIGEAKTITPVDTGALRSSGHVELPKFESDQVVVEAGFGGAAQEYAIYVHEDLTKYHQPPTSAKFLEEPFNRRAQGFSERIGNRLKQLLR